jgi:acetate---CoA ligase (ADP-forming)
MNDSLLPFFKPKGVVVIGASTNPLKPGFGAARNLAESGYRGAINYVSQKAGELFSHPVYSSIADVPEPLDLAVIVVPAAAVARSLEECAERGIKAAIILSGGFRELSEKGAILEAELLSIAQAHGIRVIGPNCVGEIDVHFPLDTSFLPPPLPPAGEVAVISQSGSMLAILIDWARSEQVGFSRMLSLGNKADVNEADVLAAAIEQEETRLLVMYIESLNDGPRFLEEARKASRKKPIIALKVGRGEAGQRAAASHTGALAGSDIAYQRAFERAGILQANTSDELFDWIVAFTRCPLPAGKRVAILTNAGGPGVIATDAVESYGMQLAELSASTISVLPEFLSPSASFHNPVDMLASASPKDYARSLKIMIEDPNVDSVIVILPAPPMFTPEEVVEAMLPIIKGSPKPVLVNLLGQLRISTALERLRMEHVAVYPSTERAVAALAGLVRRAEFECATDHPIQELKKNNHNAAENILAGIPAGSWLGPDAVDRLMTAYGIRTAALISTKTPEEAAAMGASLGFPLVVKVSSPDISHKSDLGGVMLGVKSAQEAAEAFCLVTDRARKAKPQARIEGAHIQRMLPPGQDVIVGAVRDAIFGPLMMFGSGGVEVEGLKDVAFDLAPLSSENAERMLTCTWAGRKLSGFRSIPPADAVAVRDVLISLANLAQDFPQIAEIEINPLRVLAPGEGAVAMDVRVRL